MYCARYGRHAGPACSAAATAAHSMAMMVAATTLVAAGVALFKLAPRPRRR
ncbi:hypothetical protein [Streptomyces sp. NPDC001348]